MVFMVYDANRTKTKRGPMLTLGHAGLASAYELLEREVVDFGVLKDVQHALRRLQGIHVPATGLVLGRVMGSV